MVQVVGRHGLVVLFSVVDVVITLSVSHLGICNSKCRDKANEQGSVSEGFQVRVGGCRRSLQSVILDLMSPSILVIHPDSNAPRRGSKNTPSIVIDIYLTPAPMQQIGPSLTPVFGTDEHFLGGICPAICHENSKTRSYSCRIFARDKSKPSEADTVWVVKVVKLPPVGINSTGEDNLGKDLATEWRFHEALTIRSGIAIEVTVEDAGNSAVCAEEYESISQGEEVFCDRCLERLSFHLAAILSARRVVFEIWVYTQLTVS